MKMTDGRKAYIKARGKDEGSGRAMKEPHAATASAEKRMKQSHMGAKGEQTKESRKLDKTHRRSVMK